MDIRYYDVVSSQIDGENIADNCYILFHPIDWNITA